MVKCSLSIAIWGVWSLPKPPGLWITPGLRTPPKLWGECSEQQRSLILSQSGLTPVKSFSGEAAWQRRCTKTQRSLRARKPYRAPARDLTDDPPVRRGRYRCGYRRSRRRRERAMQTHVDADKSLARVA